MKYIRIFLIVISISILSSTQINQATAETIAVNFYLSQNGLTSTISQSLVYEYGGENLLYIFPLQKTGL